MSGIHLLAIAAVAACAPSAPEDPTPDPVPVPVGRGPEGCPTLSGELTEGVALGSALSHTSLHATPTGWVVVTLLDDLTGVSATFVDVDGALQRVVDVTDGVDLFSHAAVVAERSDDLIVVWATEHEVGWRTLAGDGTLGPRARKTVEAFTTPMTAAWYSGGLEITLGKPGVADRAVRYALDGALLAGPVDLPESNRLGGVLHHDPSIGELVHLHTVQAGLREELWRVSLDYDEGPRYPAVLHTAGTMHAGSALTRSRGSLVALDDEGDGPVVLSVDSNDVRIELAADRRGYPALAEDPGCTLAVAVQEGDDVDAIELLLYDADLEPVGTWTLLERPPGTIAGPHQLAFGHGRYALAWTERTPEGSRLWLHTWGATPSAPR